MGNLLDHTISGSWILSGVDFLISYLYDLSFLISHRLSCLFYKILIIFRIFTSQTLSDLGNEEPFGPYNLRPVDFIWGWFLDIISIIHRLLCLVSKSNKIHLHRDHIYIYIYTHHDIHDPTIPTILIIPKTKATCTYTPSAALTSGFYPTHPS